MTTLTIQEVCKTHTPNKSAISTIYGFGVDVDFTFCEVCEQNIERDYFYDDDDRLPHYTNWKVSK